MIEIKRIIDSIGLMKWVVLPAFIFAFFGGFGGQEMLQAIDSPAAIYSTGSNQSASRAIHEAHLPSFCKIIGDFEIEIEEEGDDDPHYSNRESFQPLSTTLVAPKINRVSFFPPRKSVKLFILFHSWKSFLQI